jgi:hypothetical protein
MITETSKATAKATVGSGSTVYSYSTSTMSRQVQPAKNEYRSAALAGAAFSVLRSIESHASDED